MGLAMRLTRIERGVEEGLCRCEGRFRVLPETPVAADPCKEALDDPSFWMDGEADLVLGLANDLNVDAGRRRGPIAGGEGFDHERERAARQEKHGRRAVAIFYDSNKITATAAMLTTRALVTRVVGQSGG